MKLSYYKFVALLLALFIGTTAYATNPIYDEPITIEISKKKQDKPSIKPRSIVEQDIEATYCAGVLTVVFNENLGDSNITVTNISSGEVWSDSISGYGIATLFLSGDEGYYYISIETDNGQYTGEFEL